jgi:excisionase family DNA binding protein
MEDSNSRLLDSDEVAERLNLPPTWVREAARRGELPSLKLGHYRRFRSEDVETWLTKQAGL